MLTGARGVVVVEGRVGIAEERVELGWPARVEPPEAERAQLARPPGTSPTATGRRWIAASIGGLPNPSHVDGKATASQAA